jgi:hypothetical protein
MDKNIYTGPVHNSMYQQLKARGYAAPVDVLLDIGVLTKSDYENWRFGKVDYLEQVCKVNLRKLSEIMKIVRVYAQKNDLKASWTFYRQYGSKNKKQLRFSKSGNHSIERSYATHYLNQIKSEE